MKRTIYVVPLGLLFNLPKQINPEDIQTIRTRFFIEAPDILTLPYLTYVRSLMFGDNEVILTANYLPQDILSFGEASLSSHYPDTYSKKPPKERVKSFTFKTPLDYTNYVIALQETYGAENVIELTEEMCIEAITNARVHGLVVRGMNLENAKHVVSEQEKKRLEELDRLKERMNTPMPEGKESNPKAH